MCKMQKSLNESNELLHDKAASSPTCAPAPPLIWSNPNYEQNKYEKNPF